MADLIDREALLNKLIFGNSDSIVLREYAIEFVKSAPTIDAVPVVRCKDCRYCLFDLSGREYHLCMRVENNFPARKRRNADDFCSYGERKDDGLH